MSLFLSEIFSFLVLKMIGTVDMKNTYDHHENSNPCIENNVPWLTSSYYDLHLWKNIDS